MNDPGAAGSVQPEYEGLPCVRHGCTKCCYEAEMPLTEADIVRLEALGHRRQDFALLDDERVPQLRMTDGHCIFLLGGRCSVHADRPVGCRLYPLVWDQFAGRVVRDEFCPFTLEFPRDPIGARRVEETLATLRREAAGRAAPAPETAPKA